MSKRQIDNIKALCFFFPFVLFRSSRSGRLRLL